MKKMLFILFLGILVLSATLTGFTTEEKLMWKPEWPIKIRIGAAAIGGGFYMGASSLANAIKEEWPELEVVVEQTKASVHNIKLIEADEVDFAMCTTDTIFESRIPQGDHWEDIKYTGARIMMPAWIDASMWVTLKSTGITDITQFTGTFSGMTKGSQVDTYVHKVFKLFDIKANIVNLSPADSILSLKSGTIEGMTLGHPATAISELAMTHDIHIIEWKEEQGEYFVEHHPEFNFPITIPGGYYKGIDEPVTTFGDYDIVIVREELPEDMVYTVLKAVYKHQDIIEDTWPMFGQSMKEPNLVGEMNSPMHKGSIKYYREIDVELSEAATSLNE